MTVKHPPREFIEVLKEFENGALIYDLTQKLQEVTFAVMDTRKPGSLTLTMNIAPTGKGTVTMTTDMKYKEPKHDRPSTSFFVDGDFQLHRDDPRQVPMDLRTPDDDSDLPEALREPPTADTQPLRVVGDEE